MVVVVYGLNDSSRAVYRAPRILADIPTLGQHVLAVLLGGALLAVGEGLTAGLGDCTQSLFGAVGADGGERHSRKVLFWYLSLIFIIKKIQLGFNDKRLYLNLTIF